MDEMIMEGVDLDELHGRVMSFYIGDAIYGVELLHVIEIISVQNITAVPNLPMYIKGLINLRGKVVPVIDVRLKFNMEEREYDDKTCIIVVDIHDMQVGLIVDSVAEVVTLDSEAVSRPMEFSSTDTNKYLSSVAKIGDHIVLIIDCEKFFQSDLSSVHM